MPGCYHRIFGPQDARKGMTSGQPGRNGGGLTWSIGPPHLLSAVPSATGPFNSSS